MALDQPVIVAFAALAGSVVGACSSVAATFIGQRLQARWSRLGAELEEREKLYGIFVEEAVHLYTDSLQRSAIEPAKIMRLYSKMARIRLASTDQVLHAAFAPHQKPGQLSWDALAAPLRPLFFLAL